MPRAPSSSDGCPICGSDVPQGDGEAATPFAPFCSQRCKMVDLGRWFHGEYVVAGEDGVALDPEELEELGGGLDTDA